MAPISTGLGEIYQYVVRPKKVMNTVTMRCNSEPFKIGLFADNY